MRLLKKPTFIIGIAALSFVGLSFMSDYSHTAVSPVSSTESPVGLNIGDKAPEISLKDPEGNIRNLSDLKGKIVLIDFWASWCGPCRMENPNVVRTYDKYKDAQFKTAKGFEIFSVSLDKFDAKWVGAIKKDKLKWENHVSDLQGWASAGARTYRVNSIPATFLIDEDGVILAKNLRGSALANTLKKLAK